MKVKNKVEGIKVSLNLKLENGIHKFKSNS